MEEHLQIEVESALKEYLKRDLKTMDFIMSSLVPRSKTQSNLYYQEGWKKVFVQIINH